MNLLHQFSLQVFYAYLKINTGYQSVLKQTLFKHRFRCMKVFKKKKFSENKITIKAHT